MQISRMVCKLCSFKDFKLAYEVKFELGGQLTLFEKVAQLNEKYC